MKNTPTVQAIEEPLTLPTYPLGKPEKHPLFFEKRVYQGSSGKIYPVPFIDKVYDSPEPVTYRSVRLENEFVRLVLLPEIGGRIFTGQDKCNDDYDFFYRQEVIKPALVGLAGPWISGGVEFNWPQHHRPGTFLPTDFWIEEEPDGAKTVWMSEHDPINRLKGMHGIRLRPDSAVIELRGRLYNRTPETHTFLWWANVAARVHDGYQSFFPQDVNYVADHAVRALSSFPEAQNDYYGVDYASRTGANDLCWYKNIPVPTSYMVCETNDHFFGGYDHAAAGGFIHVADRHVAPGKKQWTWGNHEFGWAWDRELTDEGGPYIELMAGVYTDNQPDFTYLRPGEVKTFSQFWWPYQSIGTVQQADERLALRIEIDDDGCIDAGVAAAEVFESVQIRICRGATNLATETVSLAPNRPWRSTRLDIKADSVEGLRIEVLDTEGMLLLGVTRQRPAEERSRDLATEPPMPDEVGTSDEAYWLGEHLAQYRHPTRCSESYWELILEKDPGDARANLAIGKLAYRRGDFDLAARHLGASIKRMCGRHPNPETGEAHYMLGLVLRMQGEALQAESFLAKAAWDYAWRTPANLELAALAMRRCEWRRALEYAEAALDTNRLNNRAYIIAALAEHALGRPGHALQRIESLLEMDALDLWARWLLSSWSDSMDRAEFTRLSRNDAQTILDLAFDFTDLGLASLAVELLEWHHACAVEPVAVPNPMERSAMTYYALAWCQEAVGHSAAARATLVEAKGQSTDYLFPSRLQEQMVLQWALAQDSNDASAAYGLGNFCYDRKRHEAAISYWEIAAQARPEHATNQRNLGIAYWNVRGDAPAARNAYLRALSAAPDEPRLIAEYDQLSEKLGDSVEDRIAFMEPRLECVLQRDDACVEWVSLLNTSGRSEEALALLEGRRFHPWEGGEGKVLRQYTQACLHLGAANLPSDPKASLAYFERALTIPENLGEAYHLHQAKSDVNYWKGRALRQLGNEEAAVEALEAAAAEGGDFQQTSVIEHSPLSLYRGLALVQLGRIDDARDLFHDLQRFAEAEQQRVARIDYFATSLPNLLVFDEDLEMTKNAAAASLLDDAQRGLEALLKWQQ